MFSDDINSPPCNLAWVKKHPQATQWPTELNTTKASHLLKVSRDKLSFSYVGRGNHAKDVGAIQTNFPLPRSKLIGYFEIRVKNAGQKGSICIGLADESFPLHRHPGWEYDSFGYNGEDGRKYSASIRGEPFGPRFSVGDVVGCGVNFARHEIFFTKNGQLIDVAFQNVEAASLYPTVGLHSADEEVSINLGGQDFMFDVASMISEEKIRIQQRIESTPLPHSTLHLIVRDYLRYSGCVASLREFEAAAALDQTANCPKLENRNRVRQLIAAGKIDEAVALIESLYPGMLAAHKRAEVVLRCQQFIEIIADPSRLTEALTHARAVLGPLLASCQHNYGLSHGAGHHQNGSNNNGGSGVQNGHNLLPLYPSSNGHSDHADMMTDHADTTSDTKSDASHDPSHLNQNQSQQLVSYMQHVLGLLAYPVPAASPCAPLLSAAHRLGVADDVNQAILSYEMTSNRPVLDKVLRQLMAVQRALRDDATSTPDDFVLDAQSIH